MNIEERLTRLENVVMVLATTGGKIVNPKVAYEYGLSYEDMTKTLHLLADIRKELLEVKYESQS